MKECIECGLEHQGSNEMCADCFESQELGKDIERRIKECVTLKDIEVTLLKNHLMGHFDIQPN